MISRIAGKAGLRLASLLGRSPTTKPHGAGQKKLTGPIAMRVGHTRAPTRQKKLVDPIAVLVNRKRWEVGAADPPLVSMQMEVEIRGGLALVETVRKYKNREAKPIEALLSIPVPVHAAFFGLTARIGGTVHIASALPREEAQDEYEGAIDKGKPAVLHEELLRGVHALSIANLAPGDEAEVTTRWAEPLRYRDSAGHLRIPLTVGDVYGVSGLREPDDMVHGGPEPPTTVRIRHDASSVRLATGELLTDPDGSLSANIPASAPVDIEVIGCTSEELVGQAADGRDVRLTIEPAPDGNEDLDVAILVDHSGSMSSACEGGSDEYVSKHQAVKNALRKLDDQLRDDDRIALWEFDNRCRAVGRGKPIRPRKFRHLVSRLKGPAGGTEIGNALDAIARVDVRDVLLITDGMSYALDVQRHAQAGRRVFVVLVGEDSLEAKVGHLAALTGGDLQFSFGGDVERALAACVRGMRLRRALDEAVEVDGDGAPQLLRTARAGTSFEARWGGEATSRERDSFSEAVAAYAASLAVAASSEKVATAIAEKEGLVTHLTSLVLVVEGAEPQEELPTTIRVPLPSPRTRVMYSLARSPVMKRRAMKSFAPDLSQAIDTSRSAACVRHSRTLHSVAETARPNWSDFRSAAQTIDWDALGPALARGDLDGLPYPVAKVLRDMARRPELEDAALALGIDSLRLAIAVAARMASDASRTAARVCRRLLRNVDEARFSEFVRELEPGVTPQVQ